MRVFNLLAFGLLLISSCYKMPSATMTDEYMEVVKPGQVLGLVEVKANKIDTTFGYPSEEQPVVSYSVVERETGRNVDGNATIKIYFGRKHKKYCWKVRKDPLLADFYYTDTIKLKPYTWYRLTTEKYGFDVYFFLDRSKGNYHEKLKPKPGAW